MAEKLSVELREDFGKGAARRIRQQDKIPAVLYGRGSDPMHLVLPGHETALAARNSNALLELVLPDGSSELGMLKDIQRHPLTRIISHIDLLLVKRGEKVQVDVPVTVTGEPVPPAISVLDLQNLTIEVDALNVPENIEVSVDGQEEGFQIFAGDVTLPAGAELINDPELLVVGVQVPKVEEESEDEAEGEETEGEESEGGESEGGASEEE
ncbi:50S ribosomal protein L25/general stress protein Ctc [Brachybacterium sp. EF45031]|uniref:50S ribosomal protein L25/general stress protein Ctc n=1 Tax=Brachybacterium sillae TaxID=2810536 RepID=UPI00217DEBAE|nr:50S ribosomal protein L25/general stress protein Ctc [Brachybacterium sillae]MCS6712659.1 50S ribosomal protein L25/general stress protein Ctc [Brachybacterium sillae]